MRMFPVVSEAIREIGFKPKGRRSGVLAVRFRSGELYEYLGVPRGLFLAFLAAESHGRFFQEHVRDRFRYERRPHAA